MHSKKLIKILSSLFLLVLIYPFLGLSDTFAQSATDWATRGKTQNRSYFVSSSLSLPTNKLYLKWKRFFGERVEVEMEPLVVGNSVYVGVMNGKLYSLNADTGSVNWVFTASGPITDTPTIATINSTQIIFFGSLDGKFYAVKTGDGTAFWPQPFTAGGAIMNTPVIIGNSVFFGSLDSKVYAVNALTGQEQWNYLTDGPVSNSPSVGEITSGVPAVFISSGSNTAYAIRTNGTVAWSRKMQGLFTKRTMSVYTNGVIIFATKKPGGEYSEFLEDLPSELQGALRDGPTVINAWANYFTAHPERRTLYYFRTSDGTDLWQNSSDKSKWTPLYIPYWGEYMPVLDSAGNAWFPSSGSGGDHNLGHDMRLWKVDISTGTYSHEAYESEFAARDDEVGRMSLIGNTLVQTISESAMSYNISTKSRIDSIFGKDFIGDHRSPLEFSELPSTIFGGWQKWFTRFGSSTSAGYGGANDAISPLVVAGTNNQYIFLIEWGHLYALTNTSVTNSAKLYGNIDLASPLPTTLTKQSLNNSISESVNDIVTANQYIQPTSRYWSWRDAHQLGLFWLEGEVLRTLSDTMPYLSPSLKASLISYLKTHYLNNQIMFNGTRYSYQWACLSYPNKTVDINCSGGSVPDYGVTWNWDNENHTAEKLYALYRYGLNSNDWQTIKDNWSFIRSQFGDIDNNFDSNTGFFMWADWHSGNFYPDLQMAAVLGVREMAIQAGDNTTRDRAITLLNQMKTKRVSVGKYVRGLYANGNLARLDYTDSADWGYHQDVAPIPPEGYRDQTNDYRQTVIFTNGVADFSSTAIRYKAYPYYLIGFHPVIPDSEISSVINTSLSDELGDYIKALEQYDSWWYMGDFGHQPILGGDEEDTTSILMSTDIFQAKAYIQGKTFNELAPYLPFMFENYGSKDMFRLQNMVALMQAPGDGTPISGTPTPTPPVPGDASGDGKVDGVDYVVWLIHLGQTLIGGTGVGDFDNSGMVDGVDYVLWLNSFGG